MVKKYNMIYNFLLVGAGGAIGSMMRYGIALIIGVRSFPFATFIVNLLGCFAIGMLFGLGLKHEVTNYAWRFLGIGICGGFTTFSAFTLEGMEFLQQGRLMAFLIYVMLSICIGLISTYSGYLIAK